jgi:hypothetical protein
VLETEEKKLEKHMDSVTFLNLSLFNIALQWGKFNIDYTKSGKQISAV